MLKLELNSKMAMQVIQVVNFLRTSPLPEIPDIKLKKWKPKVSVVIPVYNEGKFMFTLLRSIQNQSLKDVEIIFVDDKSTDNSYQEMLNFQKEDKRITIIKNKKNRGILYNRMYAALQAKGEYIAFMDADDCYCNPQILEAGYNKCIEKNLDVLQFDYFGAKLEPFTKQHTLLLLFANPDRNLYDVVYEQPEIKKNYFYEEKKEFVSGIVFDKLIKKNTIIKMANYIGEDFWMRHFIYMEDFIMNLAVARTAERYLLFGFGGSWHWYENPEGMTNGVFQLEGNKLKYPEMTNKKLGDYLCMWEKSYDLTEDDKGAEYFRIKLLMLLKDPDNRKTFARTFHFERIIYLCKRLYHWKYISNNGKLIVKQFAQETLKLMVPFEEKYEEFYKNDDVQNEEDDFALEDANDL